MFRRVKKRAKASGVEFDLDVPWLLERLGRGCEISGLPFDYSSPGHRKPHAYGPAVDRIKAGGSYTKSNCRLILNCLNTALLDWGMETFLRVAQVVTEKQLVKEHWR